ncbi:hypothetical protein D3C78_1908260 [compost metagenome]
MPTAIDAEVVPQHQVFRTVDAAGVHSVQEALHPAVRGDVAYRSRAHADATVAQAIQMLHGELGRAPVVR